MGLQASKAAKAAEEAKAKTERPEAAAVTEARAKVQQGCGRDTGHACVTIGGAGDHALEQT